MKKFENSFARFVYMLVTTKGIVQKLSEPLEN